MSYLEELIKEASEACTFRGHTMVWQRLPDSGRAVADCSRCGASVGVVERPMPNEIDIGGSAVAVRCAPLEEEDYTPQMADWDTIEALRPVPVVRLVPPSQE